jgi:cyclophilin family peptidyl-prolyl cis-trans isomerase
MIADRCARAATALALAAVVLAACGTDEPTPTPRPSCPTAGPTPTSAQAELADAELAVVATNKGSFTIELYAEAAPLAAANFVALARCGYYDGISFHRVIAGFVIQAGDPQTRGNYGDFEGLGTGGPGYQFEIEPPPDALTYDQYVVAMANDTVANGSQFFINLADLDAQLRASGTYTIFGHVVEGADLVDTIAQVPVNDPRIGLPLDPVIIETITIEPAAAESPSPA